MQMIGPRSLSMRLTLPFVAVVLFLATAGSWIVTRQSFGTLEERQLATLSEGLTRVQVTAAGIEESALAAASTLENGTLPTQGNLEEALATSGSDAVLVARPGEHGGGTAGLAVAGGARPLEGTELDAVLSAEPVARVLSGEKDSLGDKFAELTPHGLVTAVPLRDSDGGLLGAAVVLTRPDRVASAMRESSGLDVAVHDSTGNLLASTYGGAGTAGPFAAAPGQVTQAASRSEVRRTDWQGGSYAVGTVGWRLRGEPAGYLAISVPSAPVAVAVDATRRQVILLFGVGLLAVVGIGLLFTQRVSQTVRRLRDGADSVASGDFGSRVEPSGRDELADLAVSFNTMAAKLSDYRDEQERVIDQLRALDEAKTELVANVSHELRTPLTPIKGAAAMLRRPDLDDGTRNQLVELIEKNGDRLLAQVNRLIVIGSVAAGGVGCAMLPIDLAALVEDEVTRVAGIGDRADVRTARDCAPIMGDEVLLRQIVHELVENAVKFTEGNIRVGVEPHGSREGYVMVSVADEGPGMTEEELADVFVAFKQGDGSTTRRHGGLGLGLTVARDLARRLDGDVVLTSDLTGGTVAIATFPMLPETDGRPEDLLLGFAVQGVPAQTG